MSDTRCTGVDNGRKVTFEQAEDGRAALTFDGAVAALAYRVGRRAKLPSPGAAIEIEGERFVVLAAKELKPLGMVRLALSPLTSGGDA